MTRVREAVHTVSFVDEYCAHFRTLFANVRHFEQFTTLHLDLLAQTKRKSLLKSPCFGGHRYTWGDSPEQVFACRNTCHPIRRSVAPRRSGWHAPAGSRMPRLLANSA